MRLRPIAQRAAAAHAVACVAARGRRAVRTTTPIASRSALNGSYFLVVEAPSPYAARHY
jgi:hypothetical protein